MSSAPGPPLVFGVDTVAVERVRDLWSTFGDALARRVATAAEAAWAGAAPERYAALLAVKESAVKALGGRPPGFRWQCIEVLTSRSASGGALGAVVVRRRSACWTASL